jgi:hypothetical protein
MRSAALAVGIAVLLGSAGLEAQTSVPGLDGAWRVIEVVSSAPGARAISTPQPGLLLITGRYYSYTLINGDRPRPDLPRGVPSAQDLLAVWNPFSANAGTFEITGDVMRRWAIVAKNPDTMAPDAFNEYTFRLSADTLWTTTVGTEAGPSRSPLTVRYERVR